MSSSAWSRRTDARETEALLDGLEVIPRRPVDYRGHTLQEMDLDALLARRPQLALVDELAHTNAPGSRHPKRYMDVEELIAAGIDVYTTLNVQHIESLNDVVARITRIRVRETVPDSIIDKADDIELIDLTPEDLIQRLKDGKVYVPHQAERAIRHYFSPGNLTALRELALRRTAQRVDEQMVRYMQAHAIPGPWAAGERILACIGSDASGTDVVRHAKRMADSLKAPWTAVHVETGRDLNLSDAERDRIAEAMRLAQRLGAETVTLPGQDVADTIADYARANNVTHIIIVQPPRAWWRELFSGSLAQQLIRKSGGAGVHVLGRNRRGIGAARVRACPPARRGPISAALRSSPCPGRRAAAASGAGSRQRGDGLPDRGAGVRGRRTDCGRRCSPASRSVLAYNFFFLPPLYTFTIADPENVVGAVLLRRHRGDRQQPDRARTGAGDRRAAAGAHHRGAVSVQPQAGGRGDSGRSAVGHRASDRADAEGACRDPAAGGWARSTVRAGFPPEDMLDDADLAAAKWCWEKNHVAGRGSDTLPGAKRLFLPMNTGRGAVGVVGIDSDEPGPLLTPDQHRLLDALADQAALAIERVNLVEDVDSARLMAETDRLRSALLTSISHDLRTPLASILGSATSLARKGRAGCVDTARPDRATSRTRPSGSIVSSATCWT